MLARDLTIRRFTPPAEKLFNLLASDMGRPVSAVRHNLVAPATEEQESDSPFPLEDLLREVIDSVSVRASEVRDKDGRWYSLRARPYMTEKKIDGAVLVLMDITNLKQAEHRAKAARDFAESIIRTVRDPLLVLRADLRVNRANDAFYNIFKTTRGPDRRPDDL